MTRTIINADTTKWIDTISEMDSVITSLPDAEETNMTPDQWEKWFVHIVAKIVEKTKNYSIFYQTDRKIDGHIIDKAFLVALGAKTAKANIVWHKICLRRGVGSIDIFRPTYTHLICVSKNRKTGKPTPDVIERGDMVYKNAMGSNACKFSINFIKNNSDTKTIFDPFCGQGSVIAYANYMGFNAVGVELLPDYCEISKNIAIV